MKTGKPKNSYKVQRTWLINWLLRIIRWLAWEAAEGPVEPGLSYHDVYISTPSVPRTSMFNLPLSWALILTRTGGWELWNGLGQNARLLAGEYEGDKWLQVDVAGHYITDSRPRSDDE